MTQWYVRPDNNGNIIYIFSDRYESPLETDIYIGTNNEQLIQIYDNMLKPLYYWDGMQLIEKTELQRYTLEERKIDKRKEIKKYARISFDNKWDTIDIAFAISQMVANGSKYQNLITDVTNWKAAKNIAFDAIDAATNKNELNSIKFQTPG